MSIKNNNIDKEDYTDDNNSSEMRKETRKIAGLIHDEELYIEYLLDMLNNVNSSQIPYYTPDEINNRIESAKANIEALNLKINSIKRIHCERQYLKKESSVDLPRYDQNDNITVEQINVSRETSDIQTLLKDAIDVVSDRVNSIPSENADNHENKLNNENELLNNEKDANVINTRDSLNDQNIYNYDNIDNNSNNHIEQLIHAQNISHDNTILKNRMIQMLSDLYKKSEICLALSKTGRNGNRNQLKEMKQAIKDYAEELNQM